MYVSTYILTIEYKCTTVLKSSENNINAQKYIPVEINY